MNRKQQKQQHNPNQPHPDLVKELVLNNIKVFSRKDGPDLLLWCNYGALTRPRPGQGLEIWGENMKIVENIRNAVYRYYPAAEVTSESQRAHIVFRLNHR